MHILQPKQTKLSEQESQAMLDSLNISKDQLPKILINDPSLPKECAVGDVIKIERKLREKVNSYYRVVV